VLPLSGRAGGLPSSALEGKAEHLDVNEGPFVARIEFKNTAITTITDEPSGNQIDHAGIA